MRRTDLKGNCNSLVTFNPQTLVVALYVTVLWGWVVWGVRWVVYGVIGVIVGPTNVQCRGGIGGGVVVVWCNRDLGSICRHSLSHSI